MDHFRYPFESAKIIAILLVGVIGCAAEAAQQAPVQRPAAPPAGKPTTPPLDPLVDEILTRLEKRELRDLKADLKWELEYSVEEEVSVKIGTIWYQDAQHEVHTGFAWILDAPTNKIYEVKARGIAFTPSSRDPHDRTCGCCAWQPPACPRTANACRGDSSSGAR